VDILRYWDADEISGNRTDAVGSFVLTDTNTVSSVVNAGGAMRNSAVYLVKANNQYLRSSAVSLDLSAGYTVSVWARPDDKTAGDWQPHYIIEKNHTWNYTNPFVIAMIGVDSQGSIYFNAQCGNDAAQTCDAHDYAANLQWAVVRYRWHHLCLVYNPALNPMLDLYVNGRKAAGHNTPTMAGAPFNAVPQPISLGYTTQGGTGMWTGAIDEPQLWTVPFDQATVLDIFNKGVGRFHPTF
jgi:Concanavalin A-like lectin/glucanases superfamily